MVKFIDAIALNCHYDNLSNFTKDIDILAVEGLIAALQARITAI
ncbi:hypothetical protein [Chlorogloeopsis sp. ULAP02]